MKASETISYLIFIPLISLMTSCGGSSSTKELETSLPAKDNEIQGPKKVHVEDFALVEPIKKIIYYLSEVDITTYDSITTQYFHAVMDYKDSNAIHLEHQLNYYESIIHSSETSEEDKLASQEEATKINQQLWKYNKEVIGYVFVHTFMNKGDTMSAIILTNSSLTKGQAIPIKKITEIEPDQFTSSIRKIEQ